MYKNALYKLLTFFSPSFNKYLSKKFLNSKNLKIVDIGFFKGSFAKSLITKVLKINKEVDINLYSFDLISMLIWILSKNLLNLVK